MAATSRLTIRVVDSIPISPRSYTLGTHIHSISFVPNRFSTSHYTRVIDAVRCKTTSRNVGVFSIRSTGSGSTGSEPEGSVQETISENPVVVYSKTWCSYSMEVKSLLRRLGVEPLVIELDQLGPQGPELQKSLEVLTGQRTVPNVFIGGKHIGGCTDAIELHQDGKLESLLSEAGAKKKKPAS